MAYVLKACSCHPLSKYIVYYNNFMVKRFNRIRRSCNIILLVLKNQADPLYVKSFQTYLSLNEITLIQNF